MKKRALSWFALAAIVPAQAFAFGDRALTGRLAILEPIVNLIPNSKRDSSASPLEAANRVIPKLAEEASGRLRWKVEIVDYAETLRAQVRVTGPTNLRAPWRVSDIRRVAEILDADYVAFYTVKEFTGARTKELPSPRTTGRAHVDLTLFERKSGKFIWQEQVIDTSTHFGPHLALGTRMDQSLYNAIRRALEPAVLHGKRKPVNTPAADYVAVVKQVVQGGKRVLLDLGSGSDAAVGDLLYSMDGKATLRIVEILQNGSIAEVLRGRASENEAFKSAGPGG